MTMMAFRRLGWWLLVLLLVAPVQGDEPQECKEEDGTCESPPQQAVVDTVDCSVYMAPSTLGDANLGIYTGVDLKASDVVNYPEIVVPLQFRSWSEHGDNDDGILWDRYIWEGNMVNLEPLENVLDKDSSGPGFIPGVGCTINSRLDLRNIESTSGSIYDTAGLHRSRDPGSGAFSPYHSSKTVSIMDIAAGSELFAEYGSEWIPELEDAIVTFDESMDAADEFLDVYKEWMDQHANELSTTLVEGLWNLTLEFPSKEHVLQNLPRRVSWSQVRETMNSDDSTGSVVRHFHHLHGKRDLEWLRQHGKCQDHMRPGLSTIPQAGRGAFAARNLPKGTVVGYAPLIHMVDNRALWDITYYNNNNNNNNNNNKKHSYTLQDLILNYSFGHANSTLLLTPYGAMVNYINHSREKANVRIQWPITELVAHKPDWLNRDLDFLQNTFDKVGLSFDYVALRDIHEGEEIFMDYGDEWQAAWDAHVRNWKPPTTNYTHSSEWKGPLLTPEERKRSPYPPNLVTLCVESYSRDHDDKQRGFTFVPVFKKSPHRLFCDVLERHQNTNGDYLYTVKLKFDEYESIMVKNVTSDGIELTDKLKTADWHLANAFRHEIMIPDSMFPTQWKNKL